MDREVHRIDWAEHSNAFVPSVQGYSFDTLMKMAAAEGGGEDDGFIRLRLSERTHSTGCDSKGR